MALALEQPSVVERCHACGGELIEEAGYALLPRVSSDCKPVPCGGEIASCLACGNIQKPVTEKFLKEIGTIYGAYDVYYQGGGMEQMVYDKLLGRATRRSDLIVNRLTATGLFPRNGRAIDLGCGNGAFLRALSQQWKEWRFDALELDRHHEKSLAAIPGFGELYVGGPQDIPGQFDLISMIHALEHFQDPAETLKLVTQKLAPGGKIFIQIPNAAQNPFDLLVADHVLHMTPQSVELLLSNLGYEIALLTTDWVMKEISILAQPGKPSQKVKVLAPERDLCGEQIRWLQDVLSAAEAASGRRPFGVFGTSIASVWLTSALGDKIDFYLDEDPSRRENTFFGKPVYKPEDAPPGSTVFVGLAPVIAQVIGTKLLSFGLNAILPPTLS